MPILKPGKIYVGTKNAVLFNSMRNRLNDQVDLVGEQQLIHLAAYKKTQQNQPPVWLDRIFHNSIDVVGAIGQKEAEFRAELESGDKKNFGRPPAKTELERRQNHIKVLQNKIELKARDLADVFLESMDITSFGKKISHDYYFERAHLVSDLNVCVAALNAFKNSIEQGEPAVLAEKHNNSTTAPHEKILLFINLCQHGDNHAKLYTNKLPSSLKHVDGAFFEKAASENCKYVIVNSEPYSPEANLPPIPKRIPSLLLFSRPEQQERLVFGIYKAVERLFGVTL